MLKKYTNIKFVITCIYVKQILLYIIYTYILLDIFSHYFNLFYSIIFPIFNQFLFKFSIFKIKFSKMQQDKVHLVIKQHLIKS